MGERPCGTLKTGVASKTAKPRFIDGIEPPASLREEEVRAWLGRIRKSPGLAPVTVAISTSEGRYIASTWDGQPGGADARKENRFAVGCIGSLLTAIVALHYVVRGVLELDRPIGAYLSELADMRVGHEVTLRHLLTHSSGYQGIELSREDIRTYRWRDLIDFLRRTPQWFQPGTVFSDDPSEEALFEKILERVVGSEASELIQKDVLAPLEIHAELTPEPPGGAQAGTKSQSVWERRAHRLAMSVEDILRVAETFTRSSRDDTARNVGEVLSQPAISLPPPIPGDGDELLRDMMPNAYGIGSGIYRDVFVGKNGLGGEAHCLSVRLSRTHGTAIVVVIHAERPVFRSAVVGDLCRAIQTDSAAERCQPVFSCKDLVRLDGEYRGPGPYRAVVSTAGNGLSCELFRSGTRGSSRIEAVLDSRGELRITSPGSPISPRFFPDGDGYGLMLFLRAFKSTRLWKPS